MISYTTTTLSNTYSGDKMTKFVAGLVLHKVKDGVPGLRNCRLFLLYGYSYHDITLLNSFQHIHSLY